MKIKEELLDEMAKLEVKALLKGLEDPELSRSPAFLAKVREFLKQNDLKTTPETSGVRVLQEEAMDIPVFDGEVSLN